jgi:hypothetical protein
VLGSLWAALGLTGVYSGCVMIGEPKLLVSGLASNYFRIRALLSTPDFGLRALTRSSVELRPPSRQRPARAQIVETAQVRHGDLDRKPIPRPWTLWTDVQGAQGPSVRPQSGWSS